MPKHKYLCFLTYGLIDDVVVWHNLLLGRKRQVLQTSISLLQVDVAKTAVEQHLARVELKLEAKLFVVDVVVASQVEKGVVEISQRFLKVAHQEIGNTLLEICDGEVLIQTHSALVAIDLS
jgi:hypothetical protein